MDPSAPNIIITGAGSGVARQLAVKLKAADEPDATFTLVSRRAGPDVMTWEQLREHGGTDATLVHTAPLPALDGLINDGGRFARIIAFSTSRLLSPPEQLSAAEREALGAFTATETALSDWVRRTGGEAVILRPTIVYGPGVRHGVNQMAALIRRFRFFPVVEGGRGLRQPVFTGDLADAVLALLAASAWSRPEYVLPGGETLRYREMLRQLFLSMGMAPRMPDLPASVVRAGIRLARLWPGLRHLDPVLARRMAEDRVYDAVPAELDLGYRPMPFRAAEAVSAGLASEKEGRL